MPCECAEVGRENLFQPQEPQVSAFPLTTSEMPPHPFPQTSISIEMRDHRAFVPVHTAKVRASLLNS